MSEEELETITNNFIDRKERNNELYKNAME